MKTITIESVIMPPEKKKQIHSAISQLQYTDLIFNTWGFGDIFEKGTAVSMIFYGIPGCGKTLMAEAIANHLGLDLLTISPAEIETQVPGGAERNIKRYFKMASGKEGVPTDKIDSSTGQLKVAPPKKHVILFDECDSLIGDRANVGMIIAGQINTILSELERFTGVVIFTTNRLGALDPAVERRLTAKIEFDFPNEEIRKSIWERMIPKKAPIDKDVDFNELAKFPLTGGNIKNIVLNAARATAYNQQKTITLDCFLECIEKEAVESKKFTEHYKNFSKAPENIIRDLVRTPEGLKKQKNETSK